MIWKIALATCASVLLCCPSIATEQTSKITHVMGDNTGPFGFVMAGSRSGKPSCAANDDTWVIPNQTSDNAKSLWSMVLTAFAAGKTVYVHGTGNCDTVATSRETIAWIVVF